LKKHPSIEAILNEPNAKASSSRNSNLICYFSSSSETEETLAGNEVQERRRNWKNKQKMRLTNVGGVSAHLPNGYKAHHKNTI
jgi:hypothetical protein